MFEAFLNKMGRDAAAVRAAVDDDLRALGRRAGAPLTPITGGASNRGYCRVTLAGNGSGPASLILMVLADPDPHQGIEEAAEYAARLQELPFVNVYEHLARAGISVPELYRYNAPHGLLYLEDCGDVPLRQVVMAADPEGKRRWLETAVDELVKLHVEGTRRRNPKFLGFHLRFDYKLLFWELNHFTDYAIRARFPGALRPEDEEVINRHFDRIAKKLLATPYVLQHRDWHMENLLVLNGKLKVIDFQDALMGPLPYDLACLLYDRDASAVLGPALIEHLVDYFADRYSQASGDPLDRAAFRESFDLCVLHRMFKVVGRFHYIHLVKKRPDFLHFLPPMHEALKRYLGKYAEFDSLGRIVGKYVQELA